MTSELRGFERSVFSRTGSCKSCKIHDLASGFRAYPGVQKVRIKKVNFSVHISYLLPTCQEKLMEEL